MAILALQFRMAAAVVASRLRPAPSPNAKPCPVKPLSKILRLS